MAVSVPLKALGNNFEMKVSRRLLLMHRRKNQSHFLKNISQCQTRSKRLRIGWHILPGPCENRWAAKEGYLGVLYYRKQNILKRCIQHKVSYDDVVLRKIRWTVQVPRDRTITQILYFNRSLCPVAVGVGLTRRSGSRYSAHNHDERHCHQRPAAWLCLFIFGSHVVAF